MKAMYEKVLPTPNSSWRFHLYRLDEIPFNWHYHSEYEICLTLNSRGQRFIGDDISNYDNFDLVFLGPNLPHTWHSKELLHELGEQHFTFVAQLPMQWLENFAGSMPELDSLGDLLQRSARGVEFSRATAVKCANLFYKMVDADPMSRFVMLFQILELLISDKNASTIASVGQDLRTGYDSSSSKAERIINYIFEHYTENLKAAQLAEFAHMSTNHFHRFIKQRTEKTFTELVTQLRIGKACSLLVNSSLPIANISERCGFNNISNFNRRFYQEKSLTPSAFRKKYLSKGGVTLL
ncbi:AraC family transcriptional regulator [uncultured Pseudoteredinibacter sp.]|uniref:AraC family transcriptional regulator n=1 Tax=uncultured Pseudoteredinibacter sp. TaxID=1641701 RepID=UPI002607E5F2|nr:AraC family transcriptional regulator [uncultured Pseudoteredinibacter sp.]